MSIAYTIQSNARRAARKAGVDPKSVYCVPEGWKFPDPPAKADAAPEPVNIASAPVDAALAVVADLDTNGLNGASVNTATALVADLDAKAVERVKAKPIKRPKTVKIAKPAKPTKSVPKVRGKRDGVCDRVIAAIHARWTSVDELLKLSGWQRHTLRGYISTRAAKDGFTVEKRKVDGVPQYRVAA